MKTVAEIEQGARTLLSAAAESGVELVICFKNSVDEVTCLNHSKALTSFEFAGIVHNEACKRLKEKKK